MERDDPPAGLIGDQRLDEIDSDARAPDCLYLDVERREAVAVAPVGIVRRREQHRVIGLPDHRRLAMVEQQFAGRIGVGDAAIRIDHQHGDGQSREQLAKAWSLYRFRPGAPQAAAREDHGA